MPMAVLAANWSGFAGPIARWMLKGRRTKHWMRTIYALQSLRKLKGSSVRAFSYRDYLQAGKSAAGVHRVESVAEIVGRFKAAAAPKSASGAGA